MNIPKIKEDESLAMWRERLAREFNLDDKMQELIREVSITSYIHGTDAILDTLKKEGKI
jgi:UDP-N-acetylglucosamine transferase subunit ALG13